MTNSVGAVDGLFPNTDGSGTQTDECHDEAHIWETTCKVFTSSAVLPHPLCSTF